MQQLELQLRSSKEGEEQLRSKLAEAQASLQQQQEGVSQAEAQLAQMVEAQRRLGQELQEGVEACEDAEASRDQAQVGTSSAPCCWGVCLHPGYHWGSRSGAYLMHFWHLGIVFAQLRCAAMPIRQAKCCRIVKDACTPLRMTAVVLLSIFCPGVMDLSTLAL